MYAYRLLVERTIVRTSSRDVHLSAVGPSFAIIRRSDTLHGEVSSALRCLEHAYRLCASIVEVGTSRHAIPTSRAASGDSDNSPPGRTAVIRLTHKDVLVISGVLGGVVDLERAVAGNATEGFLKMMCWSSSLCYAHDVLTQRPLTPEALR